MEVWLRIVSLGLHHYFDDIITSEDFGVKKPDPKPYRQRARGPGNQARGDADGRRLARPRHQGAKGVGMRTAWAKYGDTFGTKESGADFVLEDISRGRRHRAPRERRSRCGRLSPDACPARLRALWARTRRAGRLASRVEIRGPRGVPFEGAAARAGSEPQEALIGPCPTIHTFFMEFPIDVLFLDCDLASRACSILKPWRFSPWVAAPQPLELKGGVLRRRRRRRPPGMRPS